MTTTGGPYSAFEGEAEIWHVHGPEFRAVFRKRVEAEHLADRLNAAFAAGRASVAGECREAMEGAAGELQRIADEDDLMTDEAAEIINRLRAALAALKETTP